MTFIAWELPSGRSGGKMKEDKISLIYNEKGTRSITFNQTITKKILEKGYKFINLSQDDITGEIGLEVKYVNGVYLGVTGDKKHGSFNSKMSSAQWVKRVADVLKLSKDGKRHVLKISGNLSKVDKCMFFRILNR